MSLAVSAGNLLRACGASVQDHILYHTISASQFQEPRHPKRFYHWVVPVAVLGLRLFRGRHSSGTTEQWTRPRHAMAQGRHTPAHKAAPQKPTGELPKGHQSMP
jgi:hypothetical protein